MTNLLKSLPLSFCHHSELLNSSFGRLYHSLNFPLLNDHPRLNNYPRSNDADSSCPLLEHLLTPPDEKTSPFLSSFSRSVTLASIVPPHKTGSTGFGRSYLNGVACLWQRLHSRNSLQRENTISCFHSAITFLFLLRFQWFFQLLVHLAKTQLSIYARNLRVAFFTLSSSGQEPFLELATKKIEKSHFGLAVTFLFLPRSRCIFHL